MTAAVARRVVRFFFGVRVWAALLHGLLGFPLGVLGLVYLVVLLAVGPLLAPFAGWCRPFGSARRRLWAGIPALARTHRALAGGLLATPADAPPPSRPGLTNPDTWRTVLYLVLKLPVHYCAFWFCWVFWVPAGVLVLFPLMWGAVPGRMSENFPAHADPTLVLLGVDVGRWPASLLVTAVGLLVLLAAPASSRIILIDGRLARLLLGATDAQRLRASRAAAVDASASQLRRIERDLHDGAQAQLVSLAMQLGMARQELDNGDIAAAVPLIDAAHAGAKQALTELRDLARGIHPPVLDDGLGPALETLVSRSAVPADLWFTLDDRPSAAIEAIAYFSTAELLANVAKHSQAQRAVIVVERLTADRMRLLVCDDGIGGALPCGTGSGLAGLAERVGTVDGRVTVSSPPGGPTVVTVELPVRV